MFKKRRTRIQNQATISNPALNLFKSGHYKETTKCKTDGNARILIHYRWEIITTTNQPSDRTHLDVCEKGRRCRDETINPPVPPHEREKPMVRNTSLPARRVTSTLNFIQCFRCRGTQREGEPGNVNRRKLGGLDIHNQSGRTKRIAFKATALPLQGIYYFSAYLPNVSLNHFGPEAAGVRL
ncbi:hypothetical protein NPIL_554981 [Nephila pilipes]|uniref:Uncharacterized protein n=1 Tax=Nephila pilipes TaxID=299642 RepID=A0A8X6TDK6_NEPPI|nr:hypothetical protein NPIL_554981 [Nephila pilipes]